MKSVMFIFLFVIFASPSVYGYHDHGLCHYGYRPPYEPPPHYTVPRSIEEDSAALREQKWQTKKEKKKTKRYRRASILLGALLAGTTAYNMVRSRRAASRERPTYHMDRVESLPCWESYPPPIGYRYCEHLDTGGRGRGVH